jgi:hypothetical protein
MPGVRDERERVSEYTENNFYDNEAEVERGANRESHAEILRGMAVTGPTMGMPVLMLVFISVVVILIRVIVGHVVYANQNTVTECNTVIQPRSNATYFWNASLS